MIEMTILIVLGWFACGVLSYGWIFAYFQRRFATIADSNYYEDLLTSLFGLLFGPVGLVACLFSFSLMNNGRPFQYGLKFY
jgi:hypothetical protein